MNCEKRELIESLFSFTSEPLTRQIVMFSEVILKAIQRYITYS